MKIVRHCLLFVALALYALGLGEIFVRLVDPQPLVPRYITGTPWGVRGNIPNAQYWHWTEEVNVQYRINKEGMRDDREFSYDKPEGMCRVALFGDSFFVGYELDLRDTFAATLEKRLRAEGFKVEVLNFAVSGFGTAEMLRTYERYGRKFNPDVVVFQWHGSDPDDNVRSGLYKLVDGKLEAGRENYLPAVAAQDELMKFALYRLVADHSHLYSVIREKAAGKMKNLLTGLRKPKQSEAAAEETQVAEEGAEPVAGPEKKYDWWSEKTLSLSAALLQKAHETMVVDGKDFVVVDIPRRIARTEFYSTIDALPATTRASLAIVSPQTVFTRAARPDLKLYFEKGHGHLTPVGVDLLVAETLPVLRQSPQLAACHSDSLTVSADSPPG